MRPMIDTNKVFAGDRAHPDFAPDMASPKSGAPESAGSRMRSPLAQSVVMEAPVRRSPSSAPPSPPESQWREVARDKSDRARSWQPESTRPGPDVERTEAPNHGYPQLDRFLGSRVLRLEITGDGDGDARAALKDARVLKDALARAGAFAALAVPGSPSFETALGETVRGVYAWVFGTLDSLFLGDSVRPLPRRLAAALADHAEVCAVRGRDAGEVAFAELEGPLAALRDAAHRLGRARP
jgi:hypothetical protein